ncbi:hypothetical protein D3C86_1239270 [compost metagenome]
MDDRLRVDDHLHLIGPEIEEIFCLDHFQSLVEHRGAADRNLQPHRPVGMGAGDIRRDIGHLVARPGTERPAGGRQHDALHGLLMFARQALEDCAVLAVNGDQPAAALLDRAQKNITSRNQAFLVGEGYICAAPRGCQRRRETGGSGNRRHHPAGIHRCRFFEAGFACRNLYAGAGKGRFQRFVFVIFSRDCQPRAEFPRLFRKESNVARAGQRRDLERVAATQLMDHIQRAGADRTCRTQYCQLAWHFTGIRHFQSVGRFRFAPLGACHSPEIVTHFRATCISLYSRKPAITRTKPGVLFLRRAKPYARKTMRGY